MENCLKTKLNCVVQNENLPTMGYLSLYPDAAASTYSEFNKLIVGNIDRTVRIKNIGGHFIKDNQDIGNDYTIEALTFPDIFFSEDTKKILVEKYTPSLLNSYARLHYDINELKWMPQVASLSIMSGEMNFDIEKISVLSDLNHIEFNGNNLYYGNIASLKNNTKLDRVYLLGNSCASLVGDFNTWAENFPDKNVELRISNNSNLQLTCNGVNLRTISTGNKFNLAFDGEGNVTCTAIS